MKTPITQEDLDKLTLILNEEVQLRKRLADIQTIKLFYQDELDELRDTMHTTKEGQIMFVSGMTDAHLINTVQGSMEYHGSLNKVPRKYMNEIKKRKLIDQVLSTKPILSKPNNSLEYTIDDSVEL